MSIALCTFQRIPCSPSYYRTFNPLKTTPNGSACPKLLFGKDISLLPLTSTDDPLNPLEPFFLRDNLTERQADRFSKYLSTCRETLSINLILRLPMMNQERSRLIRWRLRLLPHGRSYPCPLYPDQFFNSSHSIYCLNIHSRLKISHTQTPHKKHRSLNLVSPWYMRWSSICFILQETDYLAHSTVPPPLPKPGFLLI